LRRADFVRDRQPEWDELRTLVQRARGRAERLGPVGALRLGNLYRATTADLALARRCFVGDPVVTQLDDLVSRSRSLVYGRARRTTSVRHFFSVVYWRRVREAKPQLAIAAALVVVVWVLTAVWAWRNPARALAVSPGSFRSWTEPHRVHPTPSPTQSAAFASALFTNNIRVTLLAFAAGIAAGLGSALVLVYNALVIGAVTGLAIQAGNGRYLLEWIPAHGILEISCIVVGGAAGMRMGWSLVNPGPRRRGEALRLAARHSIEIVLGTLPWLVVAGLLEGFVSPSGIGLAPRIVIGLGVAGLYWSLVLWRGRTAGDEDASAFDDLPRVTAALAPSP
jgi:uncharacterized membrane protein SpoIIM required for sporulation